MNNEERIIQILEQVAVIKNEVGHVKENLERLDKTVIASMPKCEKEKHQEQIQINRRLIFMLYSTLIIGSIAYALNGVLSL